VVTGTGNKTTHWICKDGRVLAVAEMDSDHIRNTLRMLSRDVRVKQCMMLDAARMLEYASDAPDGAAMCAEEGADHLMSGANFETRLEYVLKLWPVATAMCKELKKRKVKL
jgi:hypothetical protein